MLSSEGWGRGRLGGDLLLAGIFLEMSFQGRVRSGRIDWMLSPYCHGGGAGLIALFRDVFDFLACFSREKSQRQLQLKSSAFVS